ncbi:hypothetical protein CEQ90_03680 [Lewinellaceae bacterium SD302]|nr:hypothetical protein CEQ90_03680 [Lewinellaceae bacterium SD302]
MSSLYVYGYILFTSAIIFVIYLISKQLLATRRHIEEENLEDFWNGRLRNRSEDEYRRVVNHLGVCDECQARLDDITQNNKARHNVDEGIITRRF